ncbi:hypothetical protein PHYSODRAFT_263055 [Phytophthora sojae]|uniref:Uncharacterized protein n=1 Tax=Phytophthora sojae (strain P6497) TaxID=1094619 RepID=G4ZMT5_PHYSP|nr:hypothetical protein PHYSODRAFT_263055 [Phytophthora sojae]EGZ16055.1 hypothetical protein PHYSODRAFT_263055 [Phytophthora sojae]|eukprot:XP_009529804.1 hypothetical protein PHYSODRAFT_263055 [Phytophthora sojae]
MEEADFVADSDEDEQELLEQVALAEEQHTRERLEAAAAAAAAAKSKRELEPKRAPAAVVTPEKPPTVQEQPKQAQDEAGAKDEEEKEHVVEEQDEEEEVTDEDEEDDEEEEEQLDENAILEVRTVVTVDSRTWPGINKLGGSGHVVRVHREPAEDGVSENIFYDVRYVLGGFEKHIESKYVHSSKILEQQSTRKSVRRDFYHDDYINKPHEKKQRDAERKREIALAHPERSEAHAPLRKKRKRSHRAEHAERVPSDPQDEESNSDDERDTRRKVAKIDEDAFIFSETKEPSPSLEDSSRPPSDSENLPGIQSPPLRKPRGTQRRWHRILDSDDESGEESDKSNRKSVSPERAHRIML